MSYIHKIVTQHANFPISAEQMTHWFGQRIQDKVAQRKFNYLIRESAIQTKYSVIPDFGLERREEGGGKAVLFEQGISPTTATRMKLYATEALGLATQVCEKLLTDLPTPKEEITHIITVSCTGMFAPGLDIALIKKLGLSPEIERFSVNFMGCYAAFTALKMAHHICQASPTSRVLVCCVELCTLHFRDDLTDDNLLSTVLFGDGACALLVAGEARAGQQLKIEKFYSTLIPETNDLMGWYIGNQGFEMVLSAQIPRQIEQHILSSYHALLAQTGRTEADYFAIHAGGKNILQSFSRALNLPENALAHSFDVLRACGNMSSPTVLFVLSNVWNSLSTLPPLNPQSIYSAAFGPGLSVESALFTTKKL
jgi:predicted naringenin-chalcone synthase